jgi:hypothetical protein
MPEHSPINLTIDHNGDLTHNNQRFIPVGVNYWLDVGPTLLLWYNQSEISLLSEPRRCATTNDCA